MSTQRHITTRRAATLLAMAGLSLSAQAQNFSLSKFTNAQGLPQNYVYSLAQDANGYVWVGMAEGLSRYDGIGFSNYTVRDSLADNYVSRMLIDTDGNLWLGHGNGSFSVYDGRRFSKVGVPAEMSAPIRDMCLDDRGNIWAVEQNMGVVRIDPGRRVSTFFDEEVFGSRVYTSIRAINSMALLVGTTDGLLLVKVDADGRPRQAEAAEGLEEAGVTRLERARHGMEFWVCTDNGGVFRYSPQNGARAVGKCGQECSEGQVPAYDIRSIYEDESGNLYLGTWGDGVREWERREPGGDYVESLSLGSDNGLGNDYVADIMVDREGVFWFATYGAGLVAWINNFFAQYDLGEVGLTKAKVFDAALEGGRLWLATSEGVVDMDPKCMSNFDYYDRQHGLPHRVDITSIVFDRRRAQYVGTRGAGIFVRRQGESRYRPLETGATQSSQRTVNGMAIDDTCLYAATAGGLLVYRLDGGAPRHYTTTDGLPHNDINFVYLDTEGQLWMGPKDSGIATLYGDSRLDIHRLADSPVDVVGMTTDDRGRFWLATLNNGILCTDRDSVVSITTADGLGKNYCYGLARDAGGHVWVCHQPGLSSIDLSNGNMRLFGPGNGMDYEFTGVRPSGDGDLWFSTTKGVVHYIGDYDKRNSVAPIMNLKSVMVSDRPHDIHEPIDLPYPYGGEPAKLSFEFVGICMKDQSNVTYEYQMGREGDDGPARWMPLGKQNRKEFDYVPDGDYTLSIRAFNSSGIVSQRPLSIRIHIDSPFWKSLWFPAVALVLLVAGVRAFAKHRERKLRERQMELEAEVGRKTKEINEKRNELEEKNRDIMGSITYANRIQTATLPSPASLRALPFADTLLLFRPRDIVSGDFYWFNLYGNHALICCADCTGHGVPGAFMTLIGTTILNDATRDPAQRTPARLLERLDREVKHTLNKNRSVEARDGMECAIVDIDMTTGLMTSAAAKRPVVIVRKGALTTIKGTTRAVGDVWSDNEFVETTTQLRDGDCIYMYSDGYTSQLGADPAKDAPGSGGHLDEAQASMFGTKRLTTLLAQIADDPMEEQLRVLNETFDKWRHDIDAVDDVIVMGLRFKTTGAAP